MLTGKLVHLVDNDGGFLKGISRLLCAYGIQVRLFPSAEAFEATADQNEAQCMILDVHLGGMSGIELLQRLNASKAHVPVAILTADGSEKTRRAAGALGCRFCLEKPVAAGVLMSALAEAMMGSNANHS